MSTTVPTRCPICHTALRAAGEVAHCRGCGAEVDAYTRAWHGRRTWQHLVVWYGLAGLLVGLVTAFLRSLAAGESDNALLPISTGCTVAVLGLIAHRVLSGRVGGRFVALTPGGIIVGTRGTAQLIGWDEVRRTSIRDAVPRIDLHSTSVGVPLEDIFASEKEWVDFANAVKDWKARARNAAE